MVAVQFEFKPAIDKMIDSLMKEDKDLLSGLIVALKDTSLEFNKGVKMANPAKTGTSRRAWGAPIQISPTTFVVKNNVEYTPFIRYGKKKKSRYVGAPQGVTINAGKKFKDVADEYFEVVATKMAKRINNILTGFWK